MINYFINSSIVQICIDIRFNIWVFWTILCFVSILLTAITLDVIQILFFYEIISIINIMFILMLLYSTPISLCVCFTTTPPHGTVEFRLMRFTTPIHIICFCVFLRTYFAYFDTEFNFTSIFTNFVYSIFKFIFLN